MQEFCGEDVPLRFRGTAYLDFLEGVPLMHTTGLDRADATAARSAVFQSAIHAYCCSAYHRRLQSVYVWACPPDLVRSLPSDLPSGRTFPQPRISHCPRPPQNPGTSASHMPDPRSVLDSGVPAGWDVVPPLPPHPGHTGWRGGHT